MLARSVRSGLAETHHDGVIAVCDADGRLLASAGDIDRPFYLRSSAKPFQATVSHRYARLEPIELALACASHRGHPAQVAVVERMLAVAGLGEDDLACPADWPLARDAAQAVWRAGHEAPRRLWHNCSGKHAGFLRACVARGWETRGYLDPDHPLQREISEYVTEMGDHPVTPVGVDGCGAPVLRTNARAMATMFARLGTRDDLVDVFRAMHRYPALVSANGEGDASIATAIDAVAKGGAQGCIGVGLPGGVGVAVKAWDGSHDAVVVGAVAALVATGLAAGHPVDKLSRWASRPVLGGGRVVGHMDAAVAWTTLAADRDREKTP